MIFKKDWSHLLQIGYSLKDIEKVKGAVKETSFVVSGTSSPCNLSVAEAIRALGHEMFIEGLAQSVLEGAAVRYSAILEKEVHFETKTL